MSEQNGKPLEPIELVSLPAGHPARVAKEQELQHADARRRQVWENEFALTDRLRSELADVPVPESLESRLLAIPQSEDATAVSQGSQSARPRHRPFASLLNWRYAAALMLVAGLIGFLLWGRGPSGNPPLDGAVGQSIAADAVKAAGTEEIHSADPLAVKKALAAHAMDFPVMVLAPVDGVTLEGGGTTTLGTAKAAFTTWQGGGFTYTLYQFNGKNLGAPDTFAPATITPRNLWHDDDHYRVVLFPGAGGKCCWALVMNRDGAKNIFENYLQSE